MPLLWIESHSQRSNYAHALKKEDVSSDTSWKAKPPLMPLHKCLETISGIVHNLSQPKIHSQNCLKWQAMSETCIDWTSQPGAYCIFQKSGKHQATDLAVSQLRGSIITTISAHVPGPHMWVSAGAGPSSTSPEQWKLDSCVKIYNSVSARSPLTKSKSKENYRERSNAKARVSVRWQA